MGNEKKYSIDFRLQVVRRYEKGKCGYKKLAHMFNLSRDTVRDWCLNPRLYNVVQMVKKKNKKKIQGIEIQVATDPGFTDIVKTTTGSKKKTSKAIKGLKSKTTYYVRIRAYKNAADGKHVSYWKTKTVRIK